MNKVLLLLILFSGCTRSIQATSFAATTDNYIEYYELTNKAEHWFFIAGEADSALRYYNQAFASYDYVFIRDLLNAAQISIHADKGVHKPYLCRAFRYGFQIKHFENFPLLAPLLTTLTADAVFMNAADNNRAHYISTIDYAYLSKIYDIAIVEQLHKGDKHPHKAIRRAKDIETLRSWIQAYGFPGCKILGIEDTEAFAAIDKPRADFKFRVARHYPKMSYFKLTDSLFASKLALVILVHNKCAFRQLEDELRESMLRGEIHPREVAMLYDNTYRFNRLSSIINDCQMPPAEEGLFRLNIFLNYNQYDKNKLSDDRVNNLRAKWHIGTLAVDRKKMEFVSKHGFKVRYGFWNTL